MEEIAGGDASSYDTFLCYNGEDEDEARRIAEGLAQRHVRAFEASTSLTPGDLWIPQVTAAIRRSRSALVLVGKGGGQRWAELELNEILYQQRKKKIRVIPVLLPGTQTDIELPPFLRGFAPIVLGPHEEENLDALRAAVVQGTVGPITRKRRVRWALMARIAAAAAVVTALALTVGLWVRHGKRVASIERQIRDIVATGDWQKIGLLVDEGALAVSPMDEGLLQEYRGEGTQAAISALAAIARHRPDAVCPLFARIVGFSSERRYPELTYEEVASQIAGSPCANRNDLSAAQAGARKIVAAAVASPEIPGSFKARFAPGDNIDCEVLERLRLRLLSADGPPACGGGAKSARAALR